MRVITGMEKDMEGVFTALEMDLGIDFVINFKDI